MTSFPIRTPADAAAALDYFNAFHDGFIRELALHSHDRFEARGVHTMSGRLDLELVFAHYNYGRGEPPADQLVRARFARVSELVADFPLSHAEWSIDRMTIEAGSRQAGGRAENCLVTRIAQHRLEEGAWTTREGLRFAFESGEIEELFG